MVVAQPVAHGRIPAPDSSEILGSPFSSVSSSAAPKAMYASARWAGSRLLAAHRIATPRLIPVRPFPILSPHPSCDRGRHRHGGIHRRHRGRRAARAVLISQADRPTSWRTGRATVYVIDLMTRSVSSHTVITRDSSPTRLHPDQEHLSDHLPVAPSVLEPVRPSPIRSICYQGPNLSNGVFQAPLLAWASHQLLPTDPSSPTQNTSR